MSTDLYQAILARRSVRRYESEPLGESTLERVREAVENMLLEEQTVKVRRKYVTESKVEDICRKVARGPKA